MVSEILLTTSECLVWSGSVAAVLLHTLQQCALLHTATVPYSHWSFFENLRQEKFQNYIQTVVNFNLALQKSIPQLKTLMYEFNTNQWQKAINISKM